MTDISVEKKEYLPADRPWLLFEASGNDGPVSTTTIVLDFSLFTKATHYPNGFLPSGLVLGKVTTGGRGAPYSDAASNGTQTAIGFLYNAVAVPSDLTKKVAVAVTDCFAVVSESRLPANHGLDAAGKTDLKLIQFRA